MDRSLKWWDVHSDRTIPHLFTSGYKMNVLKQAKYQEVFFGLDSNLLFSWDLSSSFFPDRKSWAALKVYIIFWNKDLQKIFSPLTKPVPQQTRDPANNMLIQFTHHNSLQTADRRKSKQLGDMFVYPSSLLGARQRSGFEFQFHHLLAVWL